MKNSFFVAIRFLIFAMSGAFFIPFLRRHYGDGSYGLIALAGFLTQYIGFIAGCIGSSIGRFLNIALNKNDWQEANEIFSTALVANLFMIVMQVPFFAWGIWKLNVLIDYPPDLAMDVRIMVICNVVAFMISMLLGVLQTPIQAANRLDITMKIDVFFQLFRLGVLIFLIKTLGPKLWIVGAVGLSLTFCGIGTTYYFYRRFAPNLVFNKRYISWKWVKPVMNMAGWSVVAGLGQILFQKTDVWIINRFVDINLAGVCAALLVWPNFVQQIAKNISSLLQPVVMIDYAHGRFNRIRETVFLGARFFSLLALLACGGLMVFGEWLLEIWMDESYRKYQWYLVIMLLHFPLTLGREAIWLVFPAFNKMKYLGISNLISGLINIGASIAFVFMGFGLSGVIIATGLSLVLQRTLFLSYFAAKLLEVKYRQFVWIYIPGLVLVAVVVVQLLVFQSRNFTVTGIICLIVGMVSLAALCVFDPKLKQLVTSKLSGRKKEAIG